MKPLYIVDSDVFISAKNLYYAFEICPGFWDAIIQEHRNGRVRSVDRVQQELLLGDPEEDLVQWVKKSLPTEFFLSTADRKVISAYQEVVLWVQRHPRYYDPAKAQFATKADGWLVAYAMVHGVLVATNEQPAPESRKEAKLPDVCDQFSVGYENTFGMLRALRAKFELRPVV